MDQFNYSDAELEKIIHGLFIGTINPYSLPQDLYQETAKYLLGGTFDGFGSSLTTFTMGETDYELLLSLKDNVYLFSGAKTFNFVLEADGAIINEAGEMRTFGEFKTIAEQIFSKYYGESEKGKFKGGWLEAEYNTAQAQANNAKKWNAIEKQKSILPYLIYSTAGRACDICSHLEGVCLPVGHKFWLKYAPINHYNCLCVLLQADKEEGVTSEWSEKEVNKALKKAKVPEGFQFNPGIQKEIFSTEGVTKHPYFEVPKEYIKFAQNNFSLSIPK